MDKGLGFIKDHVDPMRVAPGTPVRLSRDHDPAATAGLKRRDADARLDEASSRSPGGGEPARGGGKRDIWAQRYWDINRWEHTWPATASR